MPTWSLSDSLKIVFKIGLFGSFIVAFIAFMFWLGSFSRDIYNIIQGSINDVSTSSSSGLLGCFISSLGIDTFLTSFISIFVSAAAFWMIAVAYAQGFKFVKTGYDMFYKAAT